MSKKHKKCKDLNYIDHLLIVISTITGCVPLSAAFASLVDISVGSMSSTNLCNNCRN